MATVVDLNNSLKTGLLQCHRQQTFLCESGGIFYSNHGNQYKVTPR